MRRTVLKKSDKWAIPYSNNLDLPEEQQSFIYFDYLSQRAMSKVYTESVQQKPVEGKEKRSYGDMLASAMITKIDPIPVTHEGNNLDIDDWDSLCDIPGLDPVSSAFANHAMTVEAFDSKKSK